MASMMHSASMLNKVAEDAAKAIKEFSEKLRDIEKTITGGIKDQQ